MKKKILITGSHRSGTTWTGKVISSSKEVRYVHEPFNISIEKYNSPIDCWFKFMPECSIKKQNHVKAYLQSFSSFVSLKDIYRSKKIKSFKDLIFVLKYIRSKIIRRTLYKDPIAIMSAEWFYKNFNTDVIVLIRHPAAFVASLKVKGWFFDFKNYQNQKQLMDGYLKPYKTQISEFANQNKDIIDQGILLWNTIHLVIIEFRKKYNDEWFFVKHEDLSKEPLEEFKCLFKYLNIPFDNNIKRYIEQTTQSKHKKNLERNSLRNIKSWKNRLTIEEIERIKKGTYDLWPIFYEEKDWE